MSGIRIHVDFGIRLWLDNARHPVSTCKRILGHFWRYPYRGRRRMLRALGPGLARMTPQSSVDRKRDDETTTTPHRIPLPNALAHYQPIYESVVDRKRPIRLLEIGDFYNGSPQMWRQYLHTDSLIVSIDINSMLVTIMDSQGSYVCMSNESYVLFLDRVSGEFGPFDVIIDDGHHTNSHMVESFRRLFENALNDNGVYIVEQVDRDYRTSHRDSRVSFVDLVKALIDAKHSHYQGTAGSAQEIPVPAVAPILGSIEIHDSLVVLHRAGQGLRQGLNGDGQRARP